MQQACKNISIFTSTNYLNFQSSEVILQQLNQIIKKKAKIHVQITGYTYCCLCQSTLTKQINQISCGHQLHKSCLISQASKISDDSFGNIQLEKLKCNSCNSLIQFKDTQRILSKKYIQKKQDDAAIKLGKMYQAEDRKRNQQKLDNKTYQCAYCVEEKKIFQFVTFNCKAEHRVCKQCAKGAIEQKIIEGKFLEEEIVCQLCNEEKQPISQQIIKQCVTKQLFQRLMNMRHKNLKIIGVQIRDCQGYVLQNTQNKLVPLLQPKFQMTEKELATFQQELERKCALINKGKKPEQIIGKIVKCEAKISYDPIQNKNQSFIKCPVCLLQMCIKGCNSSHKGNTCEKYKEWVQLNQKGDEVLEKTIKQAGMAKCPNPKCKIPILREAGCDWMRCRCGWQLCYKCSVTWKQTDPHYMSGHPPFDEVAFMRNQK